MTNDKKPILVEDFEVTHDGVNFNGEPFPYYISGDHPITVEQRGTVGGGDREFVVLVPVLAITNVLDGRKAREAREAVIAQVIRETP